MPLCAEDARPACPLAPESSCLYQLPRAPPPPIAPRAPRPSKVAAAAAEPAAEAATCAWPAQTSAPPTRTHTDCSRASIGSVRSPSSSGSSGSFAPVSFAARAPAGFTTSRLEALCTAGWLCSHLSAAWYCGVPEGMSYVVNTRSCATRRAWRPTRHVRFERNDAVANARDPPMKSFESCRLTCVQRLTTIATARYIMPTPVNAAAHDAPAAHVSSIATGAVV